MEVHNSCTQGVHIPIFRLVKYPKSEIERRKGLIIFEMPGEVKDGELLLEINNNVTIIKTVLLGPDEESGLLKDFRDLQHDHNTLYRNFWVLVAFLLGSGVLGGSIYAIANKF